MEGTVTLSLVEYEELQAFKKAFQEKKAIWSTIHSMANPYYVLISTDEALKEVTDLNNELKAEIQRLKKTTVKRWPF